MRAEKYFNIQNTSNSGTAPTKRIIIMTIMVFVVSNYYYQTGFNESMKMIRRSVATYTHTHTSAIDV